MKHQKRVTEEELRALLGPLPEAAHTPAKQAAQPIFISAARHGSSAWPNAQLARVWTDLLH